MQYLKGVQVIKEVLVHDVRGVEDQFKLDLHGFTYVKDKVIGLEDCKNDHQYGELLRPAAEELVKKMTNADAVVAFESRLRDREANLDDIGRSRAPVPSVHADFSPEGAQRAILNAIDVALGSDNKEAERFKTLAQDEANKVVIINIWRPLQVIKKDPLALCDWRSVDIEKDPQAYNPRGPGRAASMQWRYNPNNQWYWLSNQETDEVAMFVQYDSAAAGHMTLPHASFKGPGDKDLPVRRSAEVRVMAVLSKDSDKIQKKVVSI
ncbi:uncharacterized protein MELLADRAFT_59520 [Melampsora larici-populina 98AG31]|uniref:Uncharacterized protein n=1 Tax=Melampsora larici-populina (strain 98AG31 / pathotype 3-4-7) TaxID=747676 RepID=F4R7S9_MELLP|nr:uncharacterized protein MELLADRAFT_59520 [Melampsora larici-populina 98AG31]EGG11367.1 hypothetical protein MELLADRAFT_59520 [Melampsora larici-populina 98AG31]